MDDSQGTGASWQPGAAFPRSGHPVPDNDPMRVRAGAVGPALVAAAVLGAGGLLNAVAGCSSGPPPVTDPSPTLGPTGPTDPWGQLAAVVAVAQDKRYTASYTLTGGGRPTRTVSVTIAQDGTWMVAVPGGALGGTADIAIAATPAGLYQCALGATPACVRVAGPDGAVPAAADPRLEYLFTSWLRVLVDRQQALAVNPATLPGASGQCFSVEPNSATLAAPVDAGIYCYDANGTLTAATLGLGKLVLAGAPGAPPATISLPGPITPGPALGTAAPPPPPSPSPSASKA
jgi:hypothetical protein